MTLLSSDRPTDEERLVALFRQTSRVLEQEEATDKEVAQTIFNISRTLNPESFTFLLSRIMMVAGERAIEVVQRDDGTYTISYPYKS